METNNNTSKRRRPARKAEDFRLAWKELAPDDTFGGKTLAEFEAAILPLENAREEVQRLDVLRSGAQKVRDQEEKTLAEVLVLVAHSVRSHPDHGEDSPLYRAMGYVPKSERGSGLTRRNASEPSPANEEAAA
jgi:hypothetical protein